MITGWFKLAETIFYLLCRHINGVEVELHSCLTRNWSASLAGRCIHGGRGPQYKLNRAGPNVLKEEKNMLAAEIEPRNF